MLRRRDGADLLGLLPSPSLAGVTSLPRHGRVCQNVLMPLLRLLHKLSLITYPLYIYLTAFIQD